MFSAMDQSIDKTILAHGIDLPLVVLAGLLFLTIVHFEKEKFQFKCLIMKLRYFYKNSFKNTLINTSQHN